MEAGTVFRSEDHGRASSRSLRLVVGLPSFLKGGVGGGQAIGSNGFRLRLKATTDQVENPGKIINDTLVLNTQHMDVLGIHVFIPQSIIGG